MAADERNRVQSLTSLESTITSHRDTEAPRIDPTRKRLLWIGIHHIS